MLHELDTDLKAIEGKLSTLNLSYPLAAREAASARITYEIDYANTIDQIKHECIVQEKKMVVAEMEAQAMSRNESAYRKWRESEAEVDAQKKQIDVLQSILSSTQSRVKLLMIEKGLMPYTG